MVAGKTAGGGIGTVGGGGRGAVGIGSRGGTESRGGFSAGASRHDGFSSRSLASFSRPARTESYAKSFGPKLDAIRQPSRDVFRPGGVRLGEMQPLYQRRNTPTNTPETSKPIATSRSFGPKIAARRASSPDVHRPNISAFQGTKPLYQRERNTSQQIEKKTRTLSVNSFGPRLEVNRSHSIATQRPESIPQSKTRSLYERSVHTSSNNGTTSIEHRTIPTQRFDPTSEHIRISPNGETSVKKGRVDTASRWQAAVKDKQQKSIPAATIKTEAKRQTGNDGLRQLQRKTEKVSPQRHLQNTVPLKVESVSQFDRTIQESLRNPQKTPELPVQASRTSVESMPVTQKAVTSADTQRILENYVTYRASHGGMHAEPSTIQVKDIKSAEFQADLEQAARVMHAYEAVRQSGAYTAVTKEQAQHTVTAALDHKVQRDIAAKEAVRIAMTTQPDVSADAVSELRYGTITGTEVLTAYPRIATDSESQGATGTIQTGEQTEMPQQYDPLVVTESVQETKTQTQTATSTEQETEVAVETGNENIQTQSQTQTQTVQSSPQQTDSEPQTEEETEENSAEEEEATSLELEILYERDHMKNTLRENAAFFAAMYLTYVQKEETISGHSIAEIMVAYYEPLTSDIVLSGRPDDFLTIIIEQIAIRDYTSLQEVAAHVKELTERYPAITVGEKDEIPQGVAEYIRNSQHHPVISHE